MDITQALAVRATYLHAFDSFATDPVSVAELKEVGNPRFAREVLAVLTNEGLLAVDEVNGGEDVWQVVNPGTYDSHPREDAVAVIDNWLQANGFTANAPTPAAPAAKPASDKPARPKRDTNPADLPFCKCGCGANVGRKSNYKPGHDARHAGNVARAIADAHADGHDNPYSLLTELPTDALQDKAGAMAERLIDKAGGKSTVERIQEKIAANHAESDTVPIEDVMAEAKEVYLATKEVAQEDADAIEQAIVESVDDPAEDGEPTDTVIDVVMAQDGAETDVVLPEPKVEKKAPRKRAPRKSTKQNA